MPMSVGAKAGRRTTITSRITYFVYRAGRSIRVGTFTFFTGILWRRS